jgi:hypothetical protein
MYFLDATLAHTPKKSSVQRDLEAREQQRKRLFVQAKLNNYLQVRKLTFELYRDAKDTFGYLSKIIPVEEYHTPTRIFQGEFVKMCKAKNDRDRHFCKLLDLDELIKIKQQQLKPKEERVPAPHPRDGTSLPGRLTFR